MTNVDTRLQSFYERMLRLETEKRERAEDLRELSKEMKGQGISADEVAGIKLAVRRSFETAEATAKRLTREEVALQLGPFADSPLGQAAVNSTEYEAP